MYLRDPFRIKKNATMNAKIDTNIQSCVELLLLILSLKYWAIFVRTSVDLTVCALTTVESIASTKMTPAPILPPTTQILFFIFNYPLLLMLFIYINIASN